jgi:hypothetical protein
MLLSLASTIDAQIFMPAMRGAISSKPSIPTTMYSGGVGFGSSQDQFFQNICSPANVVDIFYGGSGVGSQEKLLAQSVCADMQVVDIFYGGTGYSSSEKNLIQGICTPLNVESIFKGGSGIGGTYLFKDNCTVQASASLIRSYDVSNMLSYPGSGTTLADVSGNAVDGTLVNGVGYNNSNGGSLVFDGNDDYVSFSSGFSSTDNLTYEAWVNPSSLGGWGVVLNHDSWNTGYIHFQFAGDLLQFALNGESDKYSTYSFNTNTWYQVAAVYSKSAKTISFYVNGSLTNTENYSNPPTITNTNLKMGAWDGGRFFSGKIGLVRIYNSALSASDIQTNFNGSKTRFGL